MNSPQQIETVEVNAWRDLYAAAPSDYAQSQGLGFDQVDGVELTRCASIPFTHFNCAMNLGLATPATEAQVERIVAHYRAHAIPAFTVYHVPSTQPAQLPAWLEARGFRLAGGWGRIVRDARPLSDAAPRSDLRVEKVGAATAREWAGFIDTTYRLPTSPWLLALVGRRGWHHYLLRDAEQGRIAAARSMYLHPDGMAWLGIDAPVPGVMAPSFELDWQLCHAMVSEGLALAVRGFVADIEAPSPARDTPAYRGFESLGFDCAYLRGLYVGPKASAISS